MTTQADTLKDIYKKIADIEDRICGGNSDTISFIKEELVLEPDEWEITPIVFDNPDNNSDISDSEEEINKVVTIALELARTNAAYDSETILNAQNLPVPIPDGSPITLLPKLIKLLVLYKAPLKFLMNVILDFIKEAILEIIKEKLKEKKAEVYGCVDVPSSQLIKIPKEAKQILLYFSGLPDWIGKRFEPINLNKSIVALNPVTQPDMSKFTLNGLGTIQIGYKITGLGSADTVFWDIDTRLEYFRQYIQLPEFEFVNYQRFAYIHLNYENTCNLCFLKF